MRWKFFKDYGKYNCQDESSMRDKRNKIERRNFVLDTRTKKGGGLERASIF